MAEEYSIRLENSRGWYCRQFAFFCLVGSAGTVVHYCALVAIVHLKGEPIIGSAVGFTLGAFVNYFLNYHYTFESTKSHHKTLVKFFITASAGLMINTFIMGLLIGFLNVHFFISQLL